MFAFNVYHYNIANSDYNFLNKLLTVFIVLAVLSSFRLALDDVGRNGIILLASLASGIVWTTTFPGPVMIVLKIPSPPKKIFFMPFTV